MTELAKYQTKPITRSCLTAPDAHISNYFGTCDARDIWKRYAFLATLDEMNNSTRRLAAFLAIRGAESGLPHLFHNEHRSENMTTPRRIEVARELSCDMELWRLALRDLSWRKASAHHQN